MHKTKAGERRKTLKRGSLELARDAKVLQKAAKTLPEKPAMRPKGYRKMQIRP
jgi:hypothetical protein